MYRRTIGIVAGALVAASFAAPVAQAASPAKVTVRVEAPGRTLVSTTLTTKRASVRPDGTHACSGTSAGGALWQATGGQWTGTWFDSFGDYAVDEIAGVRAPADFSAYWTFWLNGKPSTLGVCGAELEAGDEVLEYLCKLSSDFSTCTNLPLALKVVRVRAGKVTLDVVRLKGDGTSEPVVGATIRGGAQAVTSGAGGRAVVTLDAPGGKLRATHDGDVPSAPLHCTLGDGGGSCAGNDTLPPTLRLRGIPHRAHFAREDAPRELRGVARDAGGIADVSFRLTRRAGGVCTAFDGDRGRFRRCDGRRAPLVEIGDDARWSYLLPAKLAAGRYGLLLVATDKAGIRARTKVQFTVDA